MKNFFAIYDALLAELGDDARRERVTRAVSCARWALAESEEHTGIAMADGTDTAALVHPGGLEGSDPCRRGRGNEELEPARGGHGACRGERLL